MKAPLLERNRGTHLSREIFFSKELNLFFKQEHRNTPLKTDVSQMRALLLDRNTGTHLRKKIFSKELNFF